MLRPKRYDFTGAPACAASYPTFVIRNFAAWDLSDPAGAPEPQVDADEADVDANGIEPVPIELQPLVAETSVNELPPYHHVEKPRA